jgi:uncharacterized membrane protein (DUF4010 family)
MIEASEAFETLAISLGLGLLVGLQREHAESRIAGIRTFPLITVLGTLSAMVAPHVGPSLIILSMVGVIAASGLGNYLRARPWLPPNPEGKTGSGITTEMAILVMYAVGVFLVFGPAVIAIAVTGVVVLLLYAKRLLHRFVENLGEKDVHGIMQFVLLAFIILPILPDDEYGPLQVLNPRHIWIVVVLVVGISLGGYIIYRVVGERAGTVLSGVLGGLISSTATTASFARRAAAGDGRLANSALLGIMLASVVVYFRLFLELSAVAPRHLWELFLPVASIGLVTLLLALMLLWAGKNNGQIPPQENPTNLKSAFLFAALYAGVVLATAAGHKYLGQSGLYVVAGISGLSDMDAITLSSGRAVTEGRLNPEVAWRAIAIALMGSMVMKVLICGVLGTWRLMLKATGLFALNMAAGVLVVVLWPGGGEQAGATQTPAPPALTESTGE